VLGLLTGIVLGPRAIDVLSLPAGEEVRILGVAAELLLAVGLMAVALRYPVSTVRAETKAVGLLVLVVLPVMAGVVAAGAAWSLQLPLGIAIVLGAALSPTDPVLASGIATGELAEQDISQRDRVVLSVESGMNDGLAMPLLTVALAWTLQRSITAEIGVTAYETAAAIAVGAATGAMAGWALRRAEEHREIVGSVRALYTLVLAALVLGLASLLHANGLLAVLVAGFLHNHVVTGGDREIEVEIDEAMNQFLVIPVFILLGVALPWGDWAELGWGGAVLVAVALLLRRMPIVLLLRRPLRLDGVSAAWLGWFGPIGVAAVYYLSHAQQQGATEPALWAAGTLVIAASTVVHGLTASPLRVAYRRRREAHG
jgi:sodium/hydrogen antiporter